MVKRRRSLTEQRHCERPKPSSHQFPPIVIGQLARSNRGGTDIDKINQIETVVGTTRVKCHKKIRRVQGFGGFNMRKKMVTYGDANQRHQRKAHFMVSLAKSTIDPNINGKKNHRD
jgi:hypothetical protein